MGLEYPYISVHVNNQGIQNQHAQYIVVNNSHCINNFVQHIDPNNFAQPDEILPPISQLILKLKREKNYYLKHDDN